MRKLFLSIILMAFGLSAFAQPQTKYANFIPAYPPVVGESTYNNFVFNHNGLYLHDIILDSLPHYEIEQIPNQTVRFLEDGIGFYVKADSLHSNQVVYSYTVDVPPIGPFEFNANTGRFKFYPDAGDYMPFTVTFTATSGINSLSQAVDFDILPEVVPEYYAIQSMGEMPSSQEYTIIAESHTQMFLNNANRDTVYSYSISGKDIVFDNNVQNKVWGLSGREDIYELNIFAERLYIRSTLDFPQTNVAIYARELIFEDNGNEIASINTTPSAFATLTNATGMNGGNAGNITLHVKSLKANFAKRFILNGTQGQCTNRNGTPGNGGNGGVLSAPFNIENYCDFARGSAGVKYDVEGRAGHGPVIGAGQAGENGHFELNNEKYSWIHPYYFAAVIRHINDSYLNNYYSYSKTTASDYYYLINEFEVSDEWDNFDATLKVELQDQSLELESMLYRLNENLDYFGNPLGWVPMLSFEVLLNNFNNEIDRAMPTLYLNYWLQHVDQTLASWVTASQFAANQTQSEIIATQDQINSLINDIPVLEDKIEELIGQISEDSIKLEQKKAELMRKARHNVKKRNRLNKAFGICKTALNCIPGIGGVVGGVASELLTIMDYVPDYFHIADTYGYESSLENNLLNIADADFGSSLFYLQQTVNSINLDSLGHIGHDLIDNYHNLNNTIKPVYNSIKNIHNTFAKSSTPQNEVEAEFDKLCKQSVEYQQIVAELKALEQSKIEFQAKLKQTFNAMEDLTSKVSNELVTLDALRNHAFEGNSRRDLQAMQCVEKMRQHAMNRLVKYHYYMRKAYEYRLLRPYQGDYSLEYMYNRLEVLIGQAITNQGNSFDNSSPAGFTNYSTLSALFREEVSGVIENVIDELTYNAPEQTATIPFVIPKEVLDKINANEEYNLNMFDLGLFSPDEENIRIVGFDVQYMEAHVEGDVGMSTYLDLDLQHSGISKFRKNGEVYWFNHISTSTQNPHPNTWSIRYNPLTQQTSVIEPSFATQSLLYSLLGGNVNNIMLFSRPAAWSDIYMSKKVHTSGNADIVIDSLILNLQYDFTPRPEQIRNIDIVTSDGLLPYITCSEADRNGRSNGKGTFHRSYTRSNEAVTFTTMETHGNYHFINWTDRIGNVVSENTSLTINKMTDQYYRANYELWIPVLNVADTIHVGQSGGEYVVQIQNIGLGDIEMDWYVSDSLSTWVHIDGIAEGIDDGYFSFAYEPFNNQGSRIDSLEILAPEIEGMSKTIYIVQYDDTYLDVSASIEPAGMGSVTGTGIYLENDEVTLTALPVDTCFFVGWEYNGQIVSNQPQYTFTVSEDMHFIARFHQQSCSITAAANPTEGGTVNGAGTYLYGTNATLTAIANEDYAFVKWTENGETVSYDPVYAFNVSSDREFVANFRHLGNHWTPIGGTQYNMTISGIILINGVEQTVTTLEVGAFCGDECRGSMTAEYFPPTQQYVVSLTVASNQQSGETITFRLYDQLEGQELDLQCANSIIFESNAIIGGVGDWYQFAFSDEVSVTATVNPEGAGTVTGAGNFMPGTTATLTATANNGYSFREWTVNGETVSSDNPYTFTVTGATNLVAQFDLQQVITLPIGWSWWSTYIEMNGNNGLQQLEQSLGHNGLMIKTQSPYVQNYYPTLGYNYWFGSLTNVGLTNEAGYQISVSSSCQAIVAGAVADAAAHPITLRSGWNWIGYPVMTQQSLSTALANFTPEANDLIKGQNSSATYYANYGWFPTSFTLTPGQGYMYYSNATENKMLTYAIGRDNSDIVKEAERLWDNDEHAFADNLTVMAVVAIDGEEQRNNELELGAFVGGECRGSAVLTYFEPTDRWYAILTIAGEEGEEINFAVINRREGKVNTGSANRVVFVENFVVGSLDHPYEVNFSTNGALKLYPNPVDRNEVFTVDIPSEEKMVEVFVFSALGELVLHEVGSQANQRMRGIAVAGVYTVKVVCKSGNTYIGRLVVK